MAANLMDPTLLALSTPARSLVGRLDQGESGKSELSIHSAGATRGVIQCFELRPAAARCHSSLGCVRVDGSRHAL